MYKFCLRLKSHHNNSYHFQVRTANTPLANGVHLWHNSINYTRPFQIEWHLFIIAIQWVGQRAIVQLSHHQEQHHHPIRMRDGWVNYQPYCPSNHGWIIACQRSFTVNSQRIGSDRQVIYCFLFTGIVPCSIATTSKPTDWKMEAVYKLNHRIIHTANPFLPPLCNLKLL